MASRKGFYSCYPSFLGNWYNWYPEFLTPNALTPLPGTGDLNFDDQVLTPCGFRPSLMRRQSGTSQGNAYTSDDAQEYSSDTEAQVEMLQPCQRCGARNGGRASWAETRSHDFFQISNPRSPPISYFSNLPSTSSSPLTQYSVVPLANLPVDDMYVVPADTDTSNKGLLLTELSHMKLENEHKSCQTPLDMQSGKVESIFKILEAKPAPIPEAKKPMNRYALFLKEVIPRISKENPEIANRDKMKLASEMWKNLDENEKAGWENMALRLQEQHKMEHPDYKDVMRRQRLARRQYKEQKLIKDRLFWNPSSDN